MERAAEPTGQEHPLNAEDSALRDRCERIARERYLGSRVLVERVAGGVVAAVVLPEDGLDLDVSAEHSTVHPLPGEALDELAHTLQRPTRSLAD